MSARKEAACISVLGQKRRATLKRTHSVVGKGHVRSSSREEILGRYVNMKNIDSITCK